MYAKLDKLRDDLKKARAKRDAADAKLKEEENQQIVSDVASYNLSPEQLAQFLQLAGSGRLQEMLSGQVPVPTGDMAKTSVNVDASGTDEEKETDYELDNEEEDFSDEENE